jgi:glycosyltransferase involved in cell wall biosynthesis
MSIRLSVVIPTYNRAHTLAKALDSVFAQTEFDTDLRDQTEVIVVDDGSTDNTETLIETRYPNVIYHALDNNYGVSHARNRGIDNAKGQWLAFLDSDDEWMPHKIAAQFELLAVSQLKLCHTEEVWIRNGVRVNQMKKHAKSGGWIFEKCLALCAISPSSALIHRDLFDQYGLFDEALPACEDYDLWLRLTAFNEVAYVKQACLYKYGGHDDQLSAKHWGMDRFRVIALESILSNQTLNAEYQQAARATLLKKLNILAKGAAKHQNQELLSWCADKLALWQS